MPLIIITDSKLMRSFNYRAPLKGIILIIARSFPNTRQGIQGHGRVGRYDEPCERYILEGVKLIDRDLDIGASVLFSFIDNNANVVVASSRTAKRTTRYTSVAV